jgi:non-specific serine/threonine protein kinase
MTGRTDFGTKRPCCCIAAAPRVARASSGAADLAGFAGADRGIARHSLAVQWRHHAYAELFRPMAASADPTPPPNLNATRAFGRFDLRQLLGKSSATMAWLAFDTRSARELVLKCRECRSTHAARDTAARGAHGRAAEPSSSAPVAEIGVIIGPTSRSIEAWPDIGRVQDHLGRPAEAVGLLYQALEGLLAHEAGAVHQDPQLHHLLVDDLGVVRSLR